MGTLYIVATPIGNLKDISFRAIEVLKGVDMVLAEDTRVTRKLLTHYGIHVPVEHYDERRPVRVTNSVVRRLSKGASVALASDAGTPGISDPGAKLVGFVREKFPDVHVEVIPGPSAVTAALSVSGIPANQFTFLGYPPAKRKRKKFFRNVAAISVRPVVLYESPHRIQKTLDEIGEILGKETKIFIAKELTKIHETHFCGTIAEAKTFFVDERGKGEFVLIVS